MTKTTRLLALLLCAAMLLSCIGCSQTPAATELPTTPPTEAPTEPPADTVYQDAVAGLKNAADVTMEVDLVKTTTVGTETFTETISQTLIYSGLGTGALQISSEEELDYGLEETLAFSELYSGDTLYAVIDDAYYFSGSLTAEEAADRYIPVLLLDETLYGSVTAEYSGTAATISFAEPTAAESWAVPEEAAMTAASGTAQIDANGELQEMSYTVTYTYGSSEITLEVTSRPRTGADEVVIPEDTSGYLSLQYVDAPRLSVQTSALLTQTTSATVSSLESIMSQAAAVVRNQSTVMDYYGSGSDVMTKVELGLYLMDYSTNQSQELDQEEVYRDGRYTVTVDDGVPTTQTGIAGEDIESYCRTIMLTHMVDLSFWQDAVCTDLGSLYLIELTLNEDFGNTIQNSICNMFWEDAAFLNNLASAYVTNETTGYFAVDKFTGLPTSGGYYYKGTHTIDGADYALTLQSDQSIDGAALEAYWNITEEMPPEEEPEAKPTPLFYHVTGDDGQEMWLFGTIHVGDERTAYLPQEIYDALAASDALALEYNSTAFDEKLEEDDDLQSQISALYYYSDGTSAEDHFDPELYPRALQMMKATGNYSMNTPYMKLSIWSQSIENFYLRQGYRLSSEQGLESRLERLAEEQNKQIRDIESALAQITMSTGWSEELQQVLLEDSLEYTAEDYWESVDELYEKWCAGDEAVLREELSDEVDTSELTEEELAEYQAQLPLLEEYNKGMSYDRNDGMLKVAIDYLESGDVVFYAVGLAHLLNDHNGLVDTLREAGYTVELVQFAG